MKQFISPLKGFLDLHSFSSLDEYFNYNNLHVLYKLYSDFCAQHEYICCYVLNPIYTYYFIVPLCTHYSIKVAMSFLFYSYAIS